MLLLSATWAASPAPGGIRVLLLTGASNHDWKATTPVIRQILERAGRFDVSVFDDAASMKPSDLEGFDVLLSNYNLFGMPADTPTWGADMRKAFVVWLERGHGLVVVHAGSSVFYDWPEFQTLAGTSWTSSTSHGRVHTAEVVMSSVRHPITGGVKNFKTRDEFWQGCRLAEGTVVLATATPTPEHGGSGRPEPLAMVNALGSGRGFTLLLGHDADCMTNEGFQQLLVHGVEWAARGSVSPERRK